jgi:hypothetical protein
MGIFQAILITFLSAIKFMAAIPLAVYQYDFSFWETFIYTTVGGVVGVIFFARFSKWIVKKYYQYFGGLRKKRNRKGIKATVANKTVQKYGLFGIAFLTPIFFSIPIGTFIALRFFPDKRKTLPVLLASVFGWSFVLSVVLTTL